MTTPAPRASSAPWRHAALSLVVAALIGAAPGTAAFQSWIERRDAGVVRQARDFSCGLASLATLLKQWGRAQATEEALLGELLDTAEAGASGRIARRGVSFADLAQLARHRGLAAMGVSVATADIARLRHPAVVALAVGEGTHFSVLRGVARSGAVLLADPSWGNRWLSSWEFRQRFEGPAGGGYGRLLLVTGPRSAETAAPLLYRMPSSPAVFLRGGLVR